MTTIGHWNGIIARFGVPTNDGRGLEISSNELLHFSHLPMPVMARAKGETFGGEAVGAITHVRVETPPQMHRPGKDLWAEGMIDLDKLWVLRPDLKDDYDHPAYLQGSDVPVPQYWPVGITVDGGEFEEADERLTIAGAWQLTGFMIEEEPSVWPGVGIQLIKIELST